MSRNDCLIYGIKYITEVTRHKRVTFNILFVFLTIVHYARYTYMPPILSTLFATLRGVQRIFALL